MLSHALSLSTLPCPHLPRYAPGPKTLCNACGVRYVRSQQRAAGVKRTAGGGHKNGKGRPQVGWGRVNKVLV